jgi:hypothetical protein
MDLTMENERRYVGELLLALILRFNCLKRIHPAHWSVTKQRAGSDV